MIRARTVTEVYVTTLSIVWQAPTAPIAAPVDHLSGHGGIGIPKPARLAAVHRGATRVHRRTSAAKTWG